MNHEKTIEITVGTFMLFAIVALLVLAFKVSGLSLALGKSSYTVTANFANIGNLKPRAAVSLAGVKIGQVEDIRLNTDNYMATITMSIDSNVNAIPTDSTASILTAGLLGANYVSLTPGFEDSFLKQGDHIDNTNQALILENLIGQLLFSLKDKPAATNN